MESISKRDFRKIYTASKKSARGKWKISLFSKRISLNWNWQRDFCYETTNIQPHRSTSKLLAIRDKGPDISRIRSKYYSLSWYLFNLNLFYWYERNCLVLVLCNCNFLTDLLEACSGNINNFSVSYSLFLCHWLKSRQGNDFFSQKVKKERKSWNGGKCRSAQLYLINENRKYPFVNAVSLIFMNKLPWKVKQLAVQLVERRCRALQISYDPQLGFWQICKS